MNSLRRLDMSLMTLVCNMKLVLKNLLKEAAKEDLTNSNAEKKMSAELVQLSKQTEVSALKLKATPTPPSQNMEKSWESMK